MEGGFFKFGAGWEGVASRLIHESEDLPGFKRPWACRGVAGRGRKILGIKRESLDRRNPIQGFFLRKNI